MAGIYIHIPFCHKACNYCDFHFSTSLGYKEELLKCIKEEIYIRKKELETPISSIYFGGGTPSILAENEIKELIDQSRKNYEISKDVEITLEANPEDLSIDLIKGFARSGINRLSIGIQSFQDNILNWMNRSHTAEQAINCIKNAKEAGITNISADIINQDFDVKLDFYDDVDAGGNRVFGFQKQIHTETLSAGVFREKMVDMKFFVGESILNGSATISLVGGFKFHPTLRVCMA